MRSSKSLFNFFLIGLALVLALIGYVFLNKSDSADQSEGLSTAGFSSGEVGASVSDEFLTTLTGLKILNLRGEVFADPVFKSLQDSNIVLREQAPGRPNPFSPVNFDFVRSVGSGASGTTATSTGGALESLRAQ